MTDESEETPESQRDVPESKRREPVETPSVSAAPLQPPSDARIFGRALGVCLLALLGVGVLMGASGGGERKTKLPELNVFVAPELPSLRQKREKLSVEPLSEALRTKGFHECNPHDPIGLGPYRPYERAGMGRMLIPQKGGHTPDMGYDVIVHFHGQSPARKFLVQVARGVSFVGIDKGMGSGRYSKPFENPGVFPSLRRSIEATLKRVSGDQRAHVRHLGLSAWSAGYGAINEILKHSDQGIDAVVLLDGLHAGWKPGAKRQQKAKSVSGLFVQPVFDFAKKTLTSDKIFIFTHSFVDPELYPSTSVTAEVLLQQLKLTPTKLDPESDKFGLASRVDSGNMHVWAYKGHNEYAHCTHLNHIVEAVQMLETAWQTPPMDRDVPFTEAPKLGGGKDDDEAAIELVPADADGGVAPLPDEPSGEVGISEALEAEGAAEKPAAPLASGAPAPTAAPAAPAPASPAPAASQ